MYVPATSAGGNIFVLPVARLLKKVRQVGQLHEDICPSTHPRLRARELWQEGEKVWAQGQLAAKAKGTEPSLLQSIWQSKPIRHSLCKGGALLGLRGVANALLMPLILRSLIEVLGDPEGIQMQWAVFLLALLTLERILGALAETWGWIALSGDLATTWMGIVSSLLMNKSFCSSHEAAAAAKVDASVLMGRELAMFHAQASEFLGNAFFSFPAVPFGGMALILLLGWPGALGTSWVIVTILIQDKIQFRGKRADKRAAEAATERLKATTNMVTAARAMKFHAWEEEFEKQLSVVRERECGHLKAKLKWSILGASIGKLTPVTASLITFVTYALVEDTMKASDMFAANAIFMTMRFAVGTAGRLLELRHQMDLIHQRVQTYLLLDERPSRNVVATDTPVLAQSADLCVDFSTNDVKSASSSSFKLSIPGQLTLGSQGKLIAVCGHVGAGKSVVLGSLVGSISYDGCAEAVQSIGWCPQRPVIISGTIRENVEFGRSCDEMKLQQALQDSCLDRDLQLFPRGIEEEIGERGVTLSGGQQARLGLARTLFGDPSFLVLDDPFAAVDAAVASALLSALKRRCTEAKGVGSLIVLNQLPLLTNFDEILFLQDGGLVAQGSFAELKEKNDEFAAFVKGVSLAQVVAVQDIDIKERVLQVDKEKTLQLENEAWKQQKQVDKEKTLQLENEAWKQEKQVAVPSLEDAGAEKKRPLNHSVLHSASVGDTKLIKKEDVNVGFVSWSVWRQYLLAPGAGLLAWVLFMYASTYGALGVRDWWMSVWADAADEGFEGKGQQLFYIGLFVAVGIAHVLGTFVLVFSMSAFGARAGINLHADCVNGLLHAPMSYFDETPSGRILSRLGSDLGVVDMQLTGMFDIFMTFLATCAMMTATLVCEAPLVLLVMVPLAPVCWHIIRLIAIVRQDAKRLSNHAMAPLLSNFEQVRQAAPLVACMGAEAKDFFVEKFEKAFDNWSRFTILSMLSRPLGQLIVYAVHVIVLLMVGLSSVFLADELEKSPGAIGMYFSYASLWGIFAGIVVALVLMLLVSGTSLERLLEYSPRLGSLPQEPAWYVETDPPEPGQGENAWPERGAICFEKVRMHYRPHLPAALDGLDLVVEGGERLGIVGRTGAGKSSLMVALFRFVDCTEGRVLIDGRDIKSLGVRALRRAISVIPQEPILLSGTVRDNLDPFSKHQLGDLLGALKDAGWEGAESVIDGEAACLSVGQKQLLAFARSLLQKCKIVVMDEPTAAIDMQTDRRIQAMVRNSFKGRTVLTVAHRLETIIDSDRIAVMDSGKLVEHGSPDELLAISEGYFATMAASHGHGKVMPE